MNAADEREDDAPLIISLVLDAATQQRFDAQRRAHFPPSRNHLASHLTLFHALPATQIDAVEAVLAQEAAALGPLPLHVTGLRSLGRGVAYAIDGAALTQLRARIAEPFRAMLTPQDAQPFRAHVTVQNKVTPDAAKRLLGELSATFQPFACHGEALALWRYRGGPWQAIARYRFRADYRAD